MHEKDSVVCSPEQSQSKTVSDILKLRQQLLIFVLYFCSPNWEETITLKNYMQIFPILKVNFLDDIIIRIACILFHHLYTASENGWNKNKLVLAKQHIKKYRERKIEKHTYEWNETSNTLTNFIQIAYLNFFIILLLRSFQLTHQLIFIDLN